MAWRRYIRTVREQSEAMSLIDTAKDVYELAKKGATLELHEELLKMREEALALQEENLSLKQRISEFECQNSLKEHLEFDGALYWRTLDDGDSEGPFCQRCYDTDQKLVRLQDASYTDMNNAHVKMWTCRACKTSY